MAHRFDVLGWFDNEFDADGFRECSVTGFNVHRSVEHYVKLYGVTAVVFLLVGGLFALTVALTRWETVALLEAGDYYRHLSMHAWSMLIFWIIFMEIAILYVGGPMVLGRKLPAKWAAAVGYVVMLLGALLIYYSIWTVSGDPTADNAPLLTAYVPLEINPLFYASAIVFLVGVTLAALPFLLTIWFEKRANPGKTLPLVTFGAFVASMIAVQSILGGLIAFGGALA